MDRIQVSSSTIASIGYDVSGETLEVEFKGGLIYQYSGVPLGLYNGLMSASSKGNYLDEYIKKGGYPYRKIK